jgi:hypothetical protein
LFFVQTSLQLFQNHSLIFHSLHIWKCPL